MLLGCSLALHHQAELTSSPAFPYSLFLQPFSPSTCPSGVDASEVFRRARRAALTAAYLSQDVCGRQRHSRRQGVPGPGARSPCFVQPQCNAQDTCVDLGQTPGSSEGCQHVQLPIQGQVKSHSCNSFRPPLCACHAGTSTCTAPPLSCIRGQLLHRWSQRCLLAVFPAPLQCRERSERAKIRCCHGEPKAGLQVSPAVRGVQHHHGRGQGWPIMQQIREPAARGHARRTG